MQSSRPASPHTQSASTRPKKKKSKKAPAIKPRAGSWSTKGQQADPDSVVQLAGAHDQGGTQSVAQQSVVLPDVEKLIRQNAITSFQGDQVYRYTTQDRIREIHVTEDIRSQLSKSLLAITWMHESTYVIPAATASQIHEIDVRWEIFLANDSPAPTADQDDSDYGEFQVPDDLIW